jgi:hypothetical protein
MKSRCAKRRTRVEHFIKLLDWDLAQIQPPAKDSSDPQIKAVLDKADKAVRELDPIVRETFRDRPEELAEWDEIMREYNDAKEAEKTEQAAGEET